MQCFTHLDPGYIQNASGKFKHIPEKGQRFFAFENCANPGDSLSYGWRENLFSQIFN